MKKDIPNILFLLGSNSWKTWILPFLQHQDYSSDFEVVTEDLIRNLSHVITYRDYSCIIFVSHHSTLERDLRLKQRLEYIHNIPIVAHPYEIVSMAYCKNAMAIHADNIDGLSTIPQLTPNDSVQYLRNNYAGYIVAKQRSGTEGENMVIFKDSNKLDIFLSSRQDCYILQPFISGVEFSVNFSCFNGKIVAFPPVWKGNTSMHGIHPSRRKRFCPYVNFDSNRINYMTSKGFEFLESLNPSGLIEIEYILTDNQLYFLEFNPRLSATMRMTSISANRSIFAELVRLVGTNSKTKLKLDALTYTSELPLPHNLSDKMLLYLKSLKDVWLSSSRITIACKTQNELANRTRQIQSAINE